MSFLRVEPGSVYSEPATTTGYPVGTVFKWVMSLSTSPTATVGVSIYEILTAPKGVVKKVEASVATPTTFLNMGSAPVPVRVETRAGSVIGTMPFTIEARSARPEVTPLVLSGNNAVIVGG